jgi:hypothetical protein
MSNTYQSATTGLLPMEDGQDSNDGAWTETCRMPEAHRPLAVAGCGLRGGELACCAAYLAWLLTGDFAWIWASPSPAGRRLRMGLGGTLACAAATSPACWQARSLGRGGFATARWPGEVVGARSAWGGGRLVLAKRD